MKPRRIDWIDAAKGYGILLIMLGHMDLPEVRTLIYTFHVPLFFFLSGVVFNAKRPLWKFFTNLFWKQIVPYFFAACVIIITHLILLKIRYPGTEIVEKLFESVIGFIVQKRYTTLWFLTCLIVVKILFCLILYFQGETRIGFWVGFLFVMGIEYNRYCGQPLPWNIDVSLMALPFYYGGYLFRDALNMQYYLLFNKYKTFWLPLFIILNCLFGYMNLKISRVTLEMFSASYGIITLSYPAAFCGILAVIVFSGIFAPYFIKYIGRNSLIYFSLHQAVVMPIVNLFFVRFNIFQDNSLSVRIARAYVTMAIILVALAVFQILICHTKLRFLLGYSREERA